MKELFNILEIFYSLSSDKVRGLLVDLSVLPEEFGGEVSTILSISGMIDGIEELRKSFDELMNLGLVGITKKDESATKIELGDRLWVEKGLTALIKKHITKETK